MPSVAVFFYLVHEGSHIQFRSDTILEQLALYDNVPCLALTSPGCKSCLCGAQVTAVKVCMACKSLVVVNLFPLCTTCMVGMNCHTHYDPLMACLVLRRASSWSLCTATLVSSTPATTCSGRPTTRSCTMWRQWALCTTQRRTPSSSSM